MSYANMQIEAEKLRGLPKEAVYSKLEEFFQSDIHDGEFTFLLGQMELITGFSGEEFLNSLPDVQTYEKLPDPRKTS